METIEMKSSSTVGDDKRNSATTVIQDDVRPPGSHTNELRQDFSIWSLASLCVCLMATWEALSSVVATALTNGGAPCLFYNYIITFLCSIAVACSLGELASIYPTAGGQYHWVAMLATSNTNTASWFTGWISVGGQVVLTASANFAAGLQLVALFPLNNPDFVIQRWQGMLFYWLTLLYSAAVNIWGSRILPHTNLAAGVVHGVGFVILVCVFAAMAPKADAKYVFLEFSNTSGWTNDGVSWLVGLLSTVYPFLGYDATCHMSEEMKNPARDVPLAMVGSVIVNGVMGLGFAIVLLFSLGDLSELLDTATGFPFIQLLLNVTKSKAGATILSLIISLTAINGATAGLTSTSRTAWAFARDNAIPYSGYFSHIDTKLHVPVRMIVCITIFEMILGFLYLGSSTAFNAVLSMAIFGMYASYLLPIIYMLLHGRKGEKHRQGPFSLGKTLGPILNWISVAWLIFAMVFSTFPSYEPVTPVNMNYCVVVMGGWMLFGGLYYALIARKIYAGPIIELVGQISH